MTVADLLESSRASHAAYRALPAPKPAGWQSHLWDAYTLRIMANNLDPDHTDPAWSADKAPHADLMRFYAEQLGLQVSQTGTTVL